MREFGKAARRPARIYFTGGTTAVLQGWRQSTIDIDIKIVPDEDALLRLIPELKESLHVNVELASPDDFIPVPDGWQDRSRFVAQEGPLAFYDFDLTSQALAKIERGHAQDHDDVLEMLSSRFGDRASLAVGVSGDRAPPLSVSGHRSAEFSCCTRSGDV
jgi:hypothetical protein